MKKNYTFLVSGLFAILIGQSAKSQLSIIAQGNYSPGGVSNSGIVSLSISGGGMFKWDAANGFVQIGAISNSYSAAGNAVISSDGTKISASVTNPATNFNEISMYDLASGTWTNLGGLVTSGWDGYVSSTWGISADGSTIVGLGMLSASVGHGVKWEAENGMQDLGSIVDGRSSRANAISTDKTVIVGWQDESNGTRRGAKWVNGVESFITDNNGNRVGEAGGVSGDGKTIIGAVTPNPYVWNETTGLTLITHPNANNFYRGGATGISDDGNTVVGFFRPFPGPAALGEGFIWTPSAGRIELNQYATGLGIDTQGLKLSLPLAISRDGKKIAGIGINTSNNLPYSFFLDLTAYLANTEVKTQNNISIFPNPVKDILTIKGDKIQNAEIYSTSGQKIRSLKLDNNKADVSCLPKGTYILSVTSDQRQQSIKFIRQ